MRTYYQKHRTIKAAQFNGHWRDLKTEPWPEAFSSWIWYYLRTYKYQVKDHHINFNEAHCITDIRLMGMDSKKIYQGDYLIIQHYIVKSHDRPHHITYLDGRRIKVIRQRNFEAHWSKYPIKQHK